MIQKIKDFLANVKWEWNNLSGKGKIVLGIANAVFLMLFYFIGIPGHKSIFTYVIGFLVIEAVFIALAYFVKTKIIDER